SICVACTLDCICTGWTAPVTGSVFLASTTTDTSATYDFSASRLTAVAALTMVTKTSANSHFRAQQILNSCVNCMPGTSEPTFLHQHHIVGLQQIRAFHRNLLLLALGITSLDHRAPLRAFGRKTAPHGD